jgi:hypothetical protein
LGCASLGMICGRALDMKMLAEQAMDVFRHAGFVITARRPRGVSGAAIIGSDDAKTGIDKRRDHVMPFPPGLRKSVQQYGGSLARSGRDEMKTQTWFDVCHRMRHSRLWSISRHFIAPACK